MPDRGAKAEPAAEAPAGFRELIDAITRRDPAAVREVLKREPGAVNAIGPHTHSGGRPQPLHVAIETGDEAIFAILLDAGADPSGDNAGYDGWSPLMLAVQWDREGMRDELIRRGAAIGLAEALMIGDDERVEAAIKADKEVVKVAMPGDGTPLHFARTRRATDLLLNAGASLTVKDKFGRTPLEAAAERGEKGRPMVRAVREHRRMRGKTAPMHVLAGVGDLSNFAAAYEKHKLEALAPRVLHAVARGGHNRLLAYLIETKGADPNLRDKRGATPLHAAAWGGHALAVRVLLRAGADPTLTDGEHHATPRQWAERALRLHDRKECAPVIEMLREAEAEKR